MKIISEDGLAMSKYILDCSRQVRPPAYLEDDPQVTITSLLKEEFLDSAPHIISALQECEWPSAEAFGLNGSQREALISGITKEFSLIQGPPGTGKTYVGVKIVELLLANKHL